MVSRWVSYGPPGRASSASPLAALVRRYDPDRFLTALFAPAEKREALFALYAFNHELARAREVTSQPMIALIRLQWWREVVEGADRSHEVATPLRQAMDAGLLVPSDLVSIIDARETEAEGPFATLEAWRDYLMGSAGGLAVAAARLLGSREAEAFRPLGAAFGAAGVLRSVPALAGRHRCLLPIDVLGRHGLSPEGLIAAPASTAAKTAIRDLADEGERLFGGGSAPSRGDPALAAALPAVLARRDLRRAPHFPLHRPLRDRLAVVRAGLRGQI